jgi:cation:H+ antiporter
MVPIVLTGSVVVIAGILLGHAGEVIARRTALGSMWTGWLLLAAATSLPEFVTDVSAVGLNAPNLAAGDLFGSSLTNMAFFGLMISALSVYKKRGPSQPAILYTVALAILLNFLGTVFVLKHSNIGFGHLRPESLTILATYLLGTFMIYKRAGMAGGQLRVDYPPSARSKGETLGRAIVLFIVGAILIFFAAPRFAESAKNLADSTGLGESFIGTALLGFATALPEFVTSITAGTLGEFDLAASNLYGSCAFNMVVFFPMDLASRTPVFSTLSPTLAISGFLALALMCLSIPAVLLRSGYRILAIHSGVLVAAYGLAVWIDYLWRAR